MSGSYPGEIWWFAGREDGAFAKGAKLLREDGKPLNVGRAAAPAVTDWDGDGDLDLVVGTIDGKVLFVPHVAVEGGPRFGEAVAVVAEGEEVVVESGDAGPCVADWDHDGRADLLLGGGDGGVRWFRNVSTAGPTALAAGVDLLAAGTWEAQADADPVPHGVRAKVAVADWNGDGRVDLLLGDFLLLEGTPPRLSADQEREKAAVEAERDALDARLSDRIEALRLLAKRRLGIPLAEEPEDRIAEISETWSRLMAQDAGLHRLQAEQSEIRARFEPFEAEAEPHGFVTVFLRRP